MSLIAYCIACEEAVDGSNPFNCNGYQIPGEGFYCMWCWEAGRWRG
jgi:hypothetical protein